ncbi:MAG: helix-turn-helix transcriptional regulator [Spirochaetes bacterium]|nr:helix-turn-helix transcriptional regulator [Spirochaetota bacterium]MBN2771244.1 helix-turn-helix transcriptional regulator [Spirochaetota bacterium]
MRKALKILTHLLDNAESLNAVSAREFADALKCPQSTVYSKLRQLINAGLITHTASGYILSEKIITAGQKKMAALSRIKPTDQEKIYGKPYKR